MVVTDVACDVRFATSISWADNLLILPNTCRRVSRRDVVHEIWVELLPCKWISVSHRIAQTKHPREVLERILIHQVKCLCLKYFIIRYNNIVENIFFSCSKQHALYSWNVLRTIITDHLSLYSMCVSTFEREPSNFTSSSMSRSRTFPTLGLHVIVPVISSPSQTVIGSLR